MKLSELKKKEKGKIISINNDQYILRRKIIEMGLMEGTIIQIKEIAPLNDPLIIGIRDYQLCLRKEEAASIEVIKL